MNDNYLSNRLSLETNIDRTGVPNCQVIVYNNGGDKQIKEWCINELGNKIKYFESPFLKPNSDCLNEMLEEVDCEYIVIIPEPIILPENWLFELVKQNDSVFNSGVVAIRFNNNNGTITSKLNAFDENVFVFQEDNNIVSGVICFNKVFLEVIGGFDNKLHSGYEYLDYSFRLGMLGFWNYYISGVTGTQIKEYEPLSYTSTQKDFFSYCKELIKNNRSIKVIFRPESKKVKFAFTKIDDLSSNLESNNKESIYNNLSNAICVEAEFITKNDIKHLDKFSNDYGLKYNIKPSKEVRRVVINFYENEQ